MSATGVPPTAVSAAAAAAAAAVLYDIDQSAFNAYMQSFYTNTPAASSSPSSCNSPSIDPQSHTAPNMPPPSFYCPSPMLSSTPSYSQMYAGTAGVGSLTPPSSTDPAALLYNNGSACNLPSNPNAATATAQNLFAYATQLHNPYYLSNGVRPGNSHSHHHHHDNKQEVKRRRRLSPEETKRLTAVFQQHTTKPDATLRQQLAEELGMTARAVQVWFQNRRAKVKREKDPNEQSLDETTSNGCVSPSLSATISVSSPSSPSSNALISALSSNNNISGDSTPSLNATSESSSSSSTPCSDMLGFSFEHLLPSKEDACNKAVEEERSDEASSFMDERKKEDLEFESMLILDDNLVDPPANLTKDTTSGSSDDDSMVVKSQDLSLALEAAGFSLEEVAASFSGFAAHATAAPVQPGAMFGTSMELVEPTPLDATLAAALVDLYSCEKNGEFDALCDSYAGFGEHCPDFLGIPAQYPLTPRSSSSPADYFTQPDFAATTQKTVKSVRAIAPRLSPYPINYGPVRCSGKEARKARSMSGSPYFKVEGASPLKQLMGGTKGYLWSS